MEELSFDDLEPDEVEIETIEAYHLGGPRFSTSFELTDENLEVSRSFLLDVEFADTLQFEVRLQIEDAIRSHVSFAPRRHVALELGGIVHDLAGGGGTVTLPEGVLTRLWQSPDGRLFAIGEQGGAYVRDAGGWQRIATADDLVLNDIHGLAADAIHSAGNAGTVLRLTGLQWAPIELPAQHNFNAIQMGRDGTLYLGGPDGVAFAIRNDELLTLEAEAFDYQDICEFQGQLYWSDANYGLSVLKGNRVEPVRELGQAFRMHASGDRLVVSGWKEVFAFDGSEWSGFELGYDGNIFLSRLDMTEYGG